MRNTFGGSFASFGTPDGVAPPAKMTVRLYPNATTKATA
ncbi:hypothetical protein ARMA_1756 [Ardenticatena maritima]|uniref:Uncharacterized protein n=1 Tax=Ardenticatena maritima TaxID=872965 RepID=A0A0M8K7E7_9CHLR|nr:hypothetical protein ARMA_1756 [Ardenticatena maritima]